MDERLFLKGVPALRQLSGKSTLYICKNACVSFHKSLWCTSGKKVSRKFRNFDDLRPSYPDS